MAAPVVAAKVAQAAASRLVRRRIRKEALRQARRAVARTGRRESGTWRWWLLGLLVLSPAGLLVTTALMITVVAGGGAASQTPTGLGGLDGLGAGPATVEGIPGPVLDAYRQAPTYAARFAPRCAGVRWSIVAGIGFVESRHGGGRPIDPNGDLHTAPIIGIPLDGANGTARIVDSDAGRFDGDRTYDRAVGPMQFIPSSWRAMGRDGNGDGTADPHNIYDAVAAAVVHLCGTRPADLADRETLAAALHGYNASRSYVTGVLAQIDRYDQAAAASAPTGQDGRSSTAQTYTQIIGLIAGSAVPYGVTDTRRTPTPGDRFSYHHRGQAVDFALPPQGARDTPALLAINRFFARYAPGLTELIYTGPGAICVRNGTVVPCAAASWGAETVADHHDHVHVAATPEALRRLGIEAG
ncbi:lytic transglycosylase domain-containing protein [Parafrankia sp. FMc2]|uniref:lytic transglycosylase domain-containing protein n=1 Tax=Parafrankia sp. FMc2 TaxID=3233196 RepID=UPI0034D58307